MKKGVPLSQSIKVGSGPWVADRPVFIMELVLSRGGVVVPISTVLSAYLRDLILYTLDCHFWLKASSGVPGVYLILFIPPTQPYGDPWSRGLECEGWDTPQH